jgi:hypothetical protein
VIPSGSKVLSDVWDIGTEDEPMSVLAFNFRLETLANSAVGRSQSSERLLYENVNVTIALDHITTGLHWRHGEWGSHRVFLLLQLRQA